MKREALHHPKFKLLARDLGVTLNEARGIIGAIWCVAEMNFWRGDIGRLTNEEIALAIDYDGDADDLIGVLISRRLLDVIADDDGRLYVHDWHEHAFDYVHARIAKEFGFFANGSAPRVPHEAFDSVKRKRLQEYYASHTLPEGSGRAPGDTWEDSGESGETSGSSTGGLRVSKTDQVCTNQGEVIIPPTPHDFTNHLQAWGALRALLPVGLQTERVQRALREWASYLTEKPQRVPIDKTIRAKAQQMSTWTEDEVEEAVNTSIAAGWGDFFRPKRSKPSTGKGLADRLREEVGGG